ncbi:MAG: SUMF1/EgtB/PvdO family nonheme iron enzyme [Planctomycetes bacterium]|nr:SUMF1/EgtB/PvdO family nonheme iron enzyme [Planctomycetota bacterium]
MDKTEVLSDSSEENVARIAKIIIESGMASKIDVQACLQALQQIRRVGVQHSLLKVMVDKGVLTPNQARAVQTTSESGDASGLMGGYKLLEKIGEGGMGVVYKAKQLSLDRVVAVKILPEDLAKDAEYVDRFDREARIAARINHPNIVGAIDVGAAAGKRYFVMEFVEGRTVGAILDDEGKMSVSRSMEVIVQITRALEAAWKNNLVHRDIKPDNILITPDGTAKLVDLGLAREANPVQDVRLTMTGVITGTPAYISPEQGTGAEVDIRSDIYSLGATFYHMVTGQQPFTGNDPVEIITARFKFRPDLANDVNSEVPYDLAAVIDTMMATAPEERYPDPQVLLHDLGLVAGGEVPEFASGTEESRRRAIESARANAGSTTMNLRPVRKKRTGTPVYVLAGAVIVGFAIIAAILMVIFKGPETNPHAMEMARSVTRKQVEAAAEEVNGLIEKGALTEAVDRAETLAARLAGGSGVEQLDDLRDKAIKLHMQQQETEVREAVKQVAGLVAAERYDDAMNKASECAAKYRGVAGFEKLESLRHEASRKKTDKEKLSTERQEKENRYNSLLEEAKIEIGTRDYATALALLAQARGIKDTDEITDLVNEARFLQFTSRGEVAEKAHDPAKALDMYRRAAEIRTEPELAAKIAELEQSIKLADLREEARGLCDDGKWADARARLTEAMAIAPEAEGSVIQEEIARCDGELAFAALADKTEKAAAGQDWQSVLALADQCLAMKPGDERSLALKRQARTALGPEKSKTNSLGMEFLLISAGEFTMGSASGDSDEKPVHKARMDAFYISRTEVTNTQFEQFMPAHRHKWKQFSPGDDMPVVAVSWVEAMAFCRWLSNKEGAEYRLPTEAEWEMAARGSDARTYPWGDQSAAAAGKFRCNFAPGRDRAEWKKDGFEFTSPVGNFPEGASPFGCLDMAGNVWEWCLDFYQDNWYSDAARPKINPGGPQSGTKRTMRGGSFSDSARIIRCTNRLGKPADFYDANVGFRVVWR